MIQLDKNDIHRAIERIKFNVTKSCNYYLQSQLYNKDINEPELLAKYHLEKAFIELLVLTEILNLEGTYQSLKEIYLIAKSEGLLKKNMGLDAPDLVWADKIDTYLDSIACGYNIQFKSTSFLIDIESIIKNAIYSITDAKLFNSPPKSEKDVHDRIESILSCIFPDLKHHPILTKPIKNFEPDTGIPSIKTLIEYKYLNKDNKDKIIVDQILADTRGYHSHEWEQFIYVIYEEKRFRSEKEWNQLLKECGIEENTKVIVLLGVPS